MKPCRKIIFQWDNLELWHVLFLSKYHQNSKLLYSSLMKYKYIHTYIYIYIYIYRYILYIYILYIYIYIIYLFIFFWHFSISITSVFSFYFVLFYLLSLGNALYLFGAFLYFIDKYRYYLFLWQEKYFYKYLYEYLLFSFKSEFFIAFGFILTSILLKCWITIKMVHSVPESVRVANLLRLKNDHNKLWYLHQ